MKLNMNGGEQALHGLAPKLNGLAPKRANSASVRRRKTNNPSFESLSSSRHEELAIDVVRAPRATQAVLEPGAIIYTQKVPTAAPHSSMQAWIGVIFVSLSLLQKAKYLGQVSRGQQSRSAYKHLIPVSSCGCSYGQGSHQACAH